MLVIVNIKIHEDKYGLFYSNDIKSYYNKISNSFYTITIRQY